MISANLEWVKSRIAEAASKAGSPPETIRLVAVSKTVSVEKIIEAHEAGAELFGENRVQEALEKIERLGQDGPNWHFIGHLQKNKVNQLLGRFDLIHSVDSAALAQVINEKSLARNLITPVLIQVNVSGEASKFGMAPNELESALRALSKLVAVRVEGLMTIPPYAPDPEKSRNVFARLRELRDQMDELGMEGICLKELSMGMSNDFAVAIEEGATLVRVGSAIFGDRPPG
ncbi:MAG: YggS family pyridoxal phosphate-dependent enzyme [Nitrospinae bacterium]|nr:YggS family pyridoxal phosphate-dependent enzyme [Nitrospinota bacterium]